MRFTIALLLAGASLGLAGCGGSSVTPTTTVAPTTVATTAPRPPRTTTAATTTAPAAPTTTTVPIEVGEQGVEGGPVSARLQKGQKVVLLVRSALADEVHVHGYDLTADVPANGAVRLPFTASIAGRFEVELESRGLAIAELDVR
jgi:ABC-type glycerol-3-phosphate transport system substrate-binding protein